MWVHASFDLLQGTDKGIFSSAFFAILAVTLLFCLGHTIMAIGTLLLDRLLVGKGLGYPYLSLFNLKRKRWDTLTGKYYLSIFSLGWAYLAVMLFFPDRYIWEVPIWKIMLGHIGFLVFVKYVISEVRSHIDKAGPRSAWVERNGSKAFNFLLFGGLGVPQIICGIFHLVKKLFRMNKFQDEFISKFKKLFLKRYQINMDVENIDSSVFWLPYVEIHENLPASAQTLQFIRNLYYFSRNLCMSFLLLFTLCSVLSVIDGSIYQVVAHGVIYLLLSSLFFVHYYNIYYNFYSKQTFRTFYVYALNLDK